MAFVDLPVRDYFTFEELVAKWGITQGDLLHLMKTQRIFSERLITRADDACFRLISNTNTDGTKNVLFEDGEHIIFTRDEVEIYEANNPATVPDKSDKHAVQSEALPALQPQDSAIEASEQESPGKLPSNSAGKLAVKAAWEIECKEKRSATDKEVMGRLQEWADSGTEPDVLKKSDKANRAVVWMTTRYKEKLYTLEACQKTLEKWNGSRE